MSAEITSFYDPATHTLSHLVADPKTKVAAVIDPVLDFDYASGKASARMAAAILAAAAARGLSIDWCLETHVHADHLSAAAFFKRETGAKIGIGARIGEVQQIFRPVFNATDLSGAGAEFDHLFEDGERFQIGSLDAWVMATPGHTPACVSYGVADAVFVGDTLFAPDYGTARADFPGGNARTLYRSIRRLLALPGETRLFLCHDYQTPGRDGFAAVSTVAAQRAGNIHVRDGIDEDEFVALREARDKTLATPQLLLPSIQVNLRSGALPPKEANGVSYLRIPVTLSQ
ncbi:MAG: MBL fold metallo-hydrolase [Acidibrevibacterium sp.]|uniref:MBL fold metallo-hydrolase n=1 Tax=Acidibrevibacterium sp. TaxID=2606776 RepID=UPI003D066D4E